MDVIIMVPRACTHARTHLLFQPHVFSIQAGWSSVVDQRSCVIATGSMLEESIILKLNDLDARFLLNIHSVNTSSL